jgi:predicted ABC-type ATPase
MPSCFDAYPLASNAVAGRQEEGRQDQVENIVIIGGPNGAGKTTAAQVVLPQQLDIREFVNADEIARGLSPFNPEGAALAAGRLMIERVRNLVQNRRSFTIIRTRDGR